MKKLLTVSIIVLAFVLTGCGPSEEKATTQEKPDKETVTEQVAETTQQAAGEVKETAQAVADKAAEVEKKAEPAIKEAAADAKEMAGQTTEAAKEMAADAKQATQAAADTVEEKATSAAAATTMAADKAVESAKQAISPEMVVLEASYGNITFPHKVHAEAYDCTTCHGDGTPAAFDLDKETAHALCRDCHKQEGAGPTDCRGCHKK